MKLCRCGLPLPVETCRGQEVRGWSSYGGEDMGCMIGAGEYLGRKSGKLWG